MDCWGGGGGNVSGEDGRAQQDSNNAEEPQTGFYQKFKNPSGLELM